MAENEELIGGEPINEETIGLKKASFFSKIKKQHLIMGVIVLVVIILTIVIVVLAVNKKKSEPEKSDGGSDSSDQEEGDTPPADPFGIINLQYKLNTPMETQIISDSYDYNEKNKYLSIFINDQKLNFTRKVKFSDINPTVKIYIT